MPNRVVTVAFEITDRERSAWLWELIRSRRGDTVEKGVWAYHVAEGDAMRDNEAMRAALDWLEERHWDDMDHVEDVKQSDLSFGAKKILLRNLEQKELDQWLASEEASRVSAAMALPARGQQEIPFPNE